MSLYTVSTKRNRVYKRKFDHEEARARYAAGARVKDLAAEYGVSWAAVDRVVRPQRLIDEARRNRHYALAGRCERCGAPKSRNGKLCIPCWRVAQTTSVGDAVLLCFGCREWKLDDEFPFSRTAKSEVRRGRHNFCRACNTKARQAYRERHKVPCVGCGKPALPPNEKGATGGREPRCKACFRKAHPYHRARDVA